MVGTLAPDEIEAFLAERQFAHLACHTDGETYVVPISYAMDGADLIGQTTEGKKVEMMRKNPAVCLAVDDVVDLINWRSVVVWGEFQELEGVEAARAMGLLIDKYGPAFNDLYSSSRRGREVVPPRLDAKPVHPVVYRIKLSRRTGRFERPDA